MTDSGMYRTPALQGWQRTNVVSAANCLREQMSRTPDDEKLRTAYEGLLDLLDPSRLLARKQREMADARHASTPIRTERRAGDRRKADLGQPGGQERRRGERRGKERRGR